MDKAAFILSISSMILSIVLFAIERHYDKKLNITNLRAEYFKTLYENYMLREIPLARRKIAFNNSGQLIGVESLQNLLTQLLEDSTYYKYIDMPYYSNLKNSVCELEDYLLGEGNNVRQYEDSKEYVLSLIENKVEKIYRCMNSKFEKG